MAPAAALHQADSLLMAERRSDREMATEKDILFHGFPESDKREFLEMGKEHEFRTHDMVIEEGQPGRSMYVIEEGKVSIWFKGAKLADLGRGDTLGTMVVLTASSRTASVRAEAEVKVLEFTREDVMNYFKRKAPRLFQQFFINLARIQVNLTRRANQRIMMLDRHLREMA
jgi:CRP-like cAMP-binding protein